MRCLCVCDMASLLWVIGAVDCAELQALHASCSKRLTDPCCEFLVRLIVSILAIAKLWGVGFKPSQNRVSGFRGPRNENLK